MAAYDGHPSTERAQEPQQAVRYAAAAEHHDPSTEQVGSSRRAPPISARICDEVAHAGERKGESMLGDGLGVDALAARPDAVGVGADDVHVGLDAGPGELHPTQLWVVVEDRAQPTGVVRVTPHQP